MSGRPSILRSAALLCAAHARRVLLRRNQFWANGMEQEAHHIDDDWSALQWALGCVFASCAEVLKAERFFIAAVARICLAAIGLREALNGLDWLIAMLECHLYDLPHGIPDPVALIFFYRHFLLTPVAMSSGDMCIRIDAVPLLMRAIQAGVGSFYLAAGLRVIRGRASALPLFFGAIVASLLANIAAHFIPGAIEGTTSWYLRYSPWLRDMVIAWAWSCAWTTYTLWRLIVCLCIGLVVSLDNRRKIAR